jgi:hypothetical protein
MLIPPSASSLMIRPIITSALSNVSKTVATMNSNNINTTIGFIESKIYKNVNPAVEVKPKPNVGYITEPTLSIIEGNIYKK